MTLHPQKETTSNSSQTKSEVSYNGLGLNTQGSIGPYILWLAIWRNKSDNVAANSKIWRLHRPSKSNYEECDCQIKLSDFTPFEFTRYNRFQNTTYFLFIFLDYWLSQNSLTTVRGHAGCCAIVWALTLGPPIKAGLLDDSGGALLPRTTASWAWTPLGPAGPLTVHCRRWEWEKNVITIRSFDLHKAAALKLYIKTISHPNNNPCFVQKTQLQLICPDCFLSQPFIKHKPLCHCMIHKQLSDCEISPSVKR